MRLYASPRPCANGCGALLEWGLDRDRNVGMIELVSREVHVCPRRVTGAYLNCACGGLIHTYADRTVEDARTGLPHDCARPARGMPAKAATPRVAPPPPALEPAPPKRSLNDALGVG